MCISFITHPAAHCRRFGLLNRRNGVQDCCNLAAVASSSAQEPEAAGNCNRHRADHGMPLGRVWCTNAQGKRVAQAAEFIAPALGCYTHLDER
jgi:hypothetical protein